MSTVTMLKTIADYNAWCTMVGQHPVAIASHENAERFVILAVFAVHPSNKFLDVGMYIASLTHPEVIIVVHGAARAGLGWSDQLPSPVTHVSWYIAPHADVDIALLCERMPLHHRFFVLAHAQILFRGFVFGSIAQPLCIHAFLQQEGATFTARLLTFFDGDTQPLVHAVQEHQAARTTSTIVVRCVCADTVNALYKGLIKINAEAPGVRARQEHKALLLGARARSQAIPSLEVLTHDVQCGHGSAVAPLDAQQVWYLQTRGIAIAQARAMVLQAFIYQVLDDTLPEVTHYINAYIQRHVATKNEGFAQ